MKKIFAILVAFLVAVTAYAETKDIRAADYATVAGYASTTFGVQAITATNYTLTTNLIVSGTATDAMVNATAAGVYSMSSGIAYSNNIYVKADNKWFIQLSGSSYTGAVWKLFNYASPTTNYFGTSPNVAGSFLTNAVWTGAGADSGSCTVKVSYVTNFIPVTYTGKTVTFTAIDGTGATNSYTIVNGVMVE